MALILVGFHIQWLCWLFTSKIFYMNTENKEEVKFKGGKKDIQGYGA